MKKAKPASNSDSDTPNHFDKKNKQTNKKQQQKCKLTLASEVFSLLVCEKVKEAST